jgi:hypothetical protein
MRLCKNDGRYLPSNRQSQVPNKATFLSQRSGLHVFVFLKVRDPARTITGNDTNSEKSFPWQLVSSTSFIRTAQDSSGNVATRPQSKVTVRDTTEKAII